MVSDWQPIDTAPKDGTRILCFWDGGCVITKWDERLRFAGWQMPPMMTVRAADRSAWFPTHWMPLPEPPA